MEQAGAFFQESGGKSIKFQDTSFYKEMYSTFYSILTLENINRENPHLNSKLKICRYILEAHYKGVMETIIHDSSNIHKNKENIVELMRQIASPS